MRSDRTSSEHSLDQFVDLVLSVAPDATLLVRMSLLSEALLRGVKLEWPEEVVSLLEVRTDGDDLVDKIFNAGNALATEMLFNDSVVRERNSGTVDLAVTSLVDELGDSGL